MQKLFDYANRYIQQSDWKDMALLKICLGSLGFLLGLSVSSKQKKPAFWTGFGLFIATYIPLMGKFWQVVRAEKTQEDTKPVSLRLDD